MSTLSYKDNIVDEENMKKITDFDARIIDANKFTKRIDTNISRIATVPSHTLGVERELRRFAMNEYLKNRNPRDLIGASDDAIDDNDANNDELLLTNAITENTGQDEIDKTRYIKEQKTYVTISSQGRPAPGFDFFANDGSSTSAFSVSNSKTSETKTGDMKLKNKIKANNNPSIGKLTTTFAESRTIAPFGMTKGLQLDAKESEKIYTIDGTNNRAVYRLRKGMDNILPTNNRPHWDLFIPPGKYTMTQLASIFQQTINKQVASRVSSINPFTIKGKKNGELTLKASDGLLFTLNFPVIAPKATNGLSDTGLLQLFGGPQTINNYTIVLNRAVTNVKSIRVISSEIPVSDTIINQSNNRIEFMLQDFTDPANPVPILQSVTSTSFGTTFETTFTLWGSVDEIRVYPANYTLPEFATELQNLLNNAVKSQSVPPISTDVFMVAVDLVKGSFSITSVPPYRFLFRFVNDPSVGQRDLYRMLGYPSATNIPTDLLNTIIAEQTQAATPPSTMGPSNLYVDSFTNLVQITTDPTVQVRTVTIDNVMTVPYGAFNFRTSPVIWLALNGYETIFDTYSLNSYFAKFNTALTPPNQIAYDTFAPTVTVFNDSPIPSLAQFNVSFFDEDGLPYNFNNVDHTFTLELTQLIDLPMGINFSSHRGTNDKTSYV